VMAGGVMTVMYLRDMATSFRRRGGALQPRTSKD
jgi:hypothetical protein